MDCIGDIGAWKLDGKETEYKSCPFTGGSILLTTQVFAKVTALMHRMKGEWLAYLIGEWDAGEVLYISDLIVPPQVVSSASVSEVNETPPVASVGVMHSHVRMGAFFSGTDDEYINSNHPVSIVVSMGGNSDTLSFKSSVKKKMPCGITMIIDMPVSVWYDVPNLDSWLEEAAKDVREKVYAAPDMGGLIHSYELTSDLPVKSIQPQDSEELKLLKPLSFIDRLVGIVASKPRPELKAALARVKAAGQGGFKGIEEDTLLAALAFIDSKNHPSDSDMDVYDDVATEILYRHGRLW